MANDFLKLMQHKTQERLRNFLKSTGNLLDAAEKARTPHNFLDIFANVDKKTPRIIAEIKYASPSQGDIKVFSDPAEIAKQYLRNGASALSVLTEPDYFKGSLVYLERVRQAFPDARLLMKDFILDEYQLLQAKIYGADAVLLIVAFLNLSQLQKLYSKAMSLGLTPLVEVHTLDELKIAQSINAKLIGINNRNLQTLTVDLSVSKTLSAHVKSDVYLISESGIKSKNDIKDLQQLGYQGFLMGSHFMSDKNPGDALKQILDNNDAR